MIHLNLKQHLENFWGFEAKSKNHSHRKTLVLILAYLLTRNGCECQRGNSNIQYSHAHQNQNVHRRERLNFLTNQHRQSRDSVSNYGRYATKLTNPCGNAQRSIVKRASHQSYHEEKTVNTFLNLAKQNLLPQNSLDLILSLAGVAKKLVEDQKKEEVRNVFHEKERNRRETELDMAEFVLRRTELRNLLSGLQTMITQHILQLNYNCGAQRSTSLPTHDHVFGNNSFLEDTKIFMRSIAMARSHLLMMRLDWQQSQGLLCAPAATVMTTTFTYKRVDQMLQELTCHILTQFFGDSSLASVVEMSSIVNEPIPRYSSCSDRKLRDCGVITYLNTLLRNFDQFVANYSTT